MHDRSCLPGAGSSQYQDVLVGRRRDDSGLNLIPKAFDNLPIGLGTGRALKFFLAACKVAAQEGLPIEREVRENARRP